MKLWCYRDDPRDNTYGAVSLSNQNYVMTRIMLEHDEDDLYAAVEAAIVLAREGATVPFDRDNEASYDFGPAHLRYCAFEGLREVAGEEIDKVLAWTREDIINNLTVED